MLLSQIAEHIPNKLALRIVRDVPIADVVHDSREVSPGALFVCRRGERFDGHDFIPQALAAGAAAVVVEGAQRLSAVPPDVPAIAVADSRLAQAAAAAACHGFPARRLTLIGVTGTNGKTSTCYFLESILRAANIRAGLMTTLEVRLAPDAPPERALRTTPEAAQIQRLLARALAARSSHVVLEVSSHALELRRVDYCEFDVAVFTNLSPEHLDFHPTMDAYFAAKLALFDGRLAGEKPLKAATNIDDPYGKKLLSLAAGEVITFGCDPSADVCASAIEPSLSGTVLRAKTPLGPFEARLNLRGEFSAYNALAAAAAALALGLSVEPIVAGLQSLPPVPGRLEPVPSARGPLVFVDYAHTPGGLRSVLKTLRQIAPRRVICVFGCGGDRDRSKRPKMGAIAAQLADLAIVTSDNPRSEDPEAIIDEILAGISSGNVLRMSDRAQAIRRAIAEAHEEDVVLIAGKGHETYQIFADKTVHFDDREVARAALKELGLL